MSYLTKILRPDEQVLAVGKLHWIIYSPAVQWLVVGVMFYGASRSGTGVWLFVLCAYISLLHGLIISIRRRTTEIAVTDRRVIYKTGLIATHTAEMNMDKIESVLVDQTMMGGLLNYGTVDIRGTGEGLENLRYISSPISLRNAVLAK